MNKSWSFSIALFCLLLLVIPLLLAQKAELQKAEELDAQVGQLYKQGQYNQAITPAREVLRLREQALGSDHPSVAASLNNLAFLYYYVGAYDQAEPLFQRALKIWETKLGPDHPDVATSLNNLAALYDDMGTYDQAELYYQRALKIREVKLGHNHPAVAGSLNNLALLYQNMGAYGQAEPLFQRALNIMEAQFGSDHPDVACCLNNLALLYLNMGAHGKAEPLFQRALKMLEAQLGPDHPDLATSIDNLAELYRTIGAYDQAEPLYKRALKIREIKLSPDHPAVAGSLNNLALLYAQMGVYDQAESLYQRALKIRETKLGPDHPDVASSLNCLAGLYEDMGVYRYAESYYQRALKILEAKLSLDHPNVATSLNNLALLYTHIGAYDHAEPLYQRAMKIQETKLGPDHPDVASSLNNLALLYTHMGAYDQAEPLYQRALKIRETKLGLDHPDVASSLNNMMVLWGKRGNLDKIMPNSKRLLRLNFHYYHTILPYLSEKRQLDYIQKNPPLSTLWPSLYRQYGQQTDELKYLTSAVLLNQKGIVYETLTSQSLSQKLVGTTLLDSLNNIRSQLANAYFTESTAFENQEQQLRYIQRLQAQQERFESQLALQDYELETQNSPITPAQLRQALADDYTLVDFWYFHNYNFISEKKGWGTWQYLAVVYQKNQATEIVVLGEADSLYKNLNELLQAIFTTQLNPFRTKQQHLAAEALIKIKGRQLYKQLFQPLLSILGDKKKVIICADGALHYLPFSVLVDEQDRYLVESYQFHYVSSGRELLQWQGGPRQAIRDAVIIADPQFETALADTKTAHFVLHSTRSKDWRQMSFSALKYAGPEAVTIEALLKREKISTKLYLKNQAKESTLKTVQSPHVLHISTHGFFLPAPEPINAPRATGSENFETTFRQGLVENPLLRCGLALAGANRAESFRDGDDGLATGFEIAGIDLTETDLVTLSACQTGIGDLKGSEGLYGLHRSFLLAGAKTVLASLWSVPDLETKELMIEFYRRYLSDSQLTKSEALRQAQLTVIKNLREKYGASPPAYWGAFVCIGEPGVIESDDRDVDNDIEQSEITKQSDSYNRQTKNSFGLYALLFIIIIFIILLALYLRKRQI